MTSAQLRTLPTHTDGTPRPRRPHTTLAGILLALAVAVLAVLTVVVRPWNLGAEPATRTPSGSLHAYLPGGSVHQQQVPEFRHWSLAYRPGGSVYRSQVPRGG